MFGVERGGHHLLQRGSGAMGRAGGLLVRWRLQARAAQWSSAPRQEEGETASATAPAGAPAPAAVPEGVASPAARPRR